MLKKGSHNIFNEAEAMRFIRARTNIPLPDVLDTWAINEDYAYLVMQRVEGVPLCDVFQKLSSAQKRTIAHELKAFVDQMRAIVVPQSPGVASVKGGTFREDRFDDEYMGPFEDERAYHDWRVSVVQAISTRHQPTMERLKIIRKELQDDHDIVFTHGDLNPGNILVKVLGDGDVHIAAVLDWEMAGWRSAYWEYVKCMHGMGGCDTEWGEFVGMVLQKYEKEKALDDELQRLSGDAY
jgi:aminoglycoside phosphotransferase (APT) family kinase protein